MLLNLLFTACMLVLPKSLASSFLLFRLYLLVFLCVLVFVAELRDISKYLFSIRVVSFGIVRPCHRSACVGRAPTRSAIVEHLVALEVDALTFDLHVHRSRGDEFYRSLDIRRDESATRALAGNIAYAFEARTADRDL